MTTSSTYISSIRSEGYCSFTIDKAAHALGITPEAMRLKCLRLIKKGELLSPVKGLYVPIAPEYKNVGSPPIEELIPLVMDYLKIDYYVCLLSAATYHGSSHQKTQVFQVMFDCRKMKIKVGKQKIDIVYKKSLQKLPLTAQPTKTGCMSISTPELTIVDLFLYPNRSGGLNSIATVLRQLIEQVDSDKLISLALRIPQKIWIQRLGYILEHIETDDMNHQDHIIKKLEEHLRNLKYSYVPLSPELSIKGCKRDKKWKIIINSTIEPGE
jgi:predicted transcriptional regulator of viral defense system